jgi:aminopeptidase N
MLEIMKFRKAFFVFLLFLFIPFVEAQTRKNTKQLTLPSAQGFNRQRSYDVQHYLIRTEFDRQNKIVFGDTTVTLKPLKDGFSTVELDAAEFNYEFVGLENGKKLTYTQLGEKLTVFLDRAYSKEELISLRFVYSCSPKKGIYFIDGARQDDGKVLWYDQIWTQNEPEEAHHWFPSYDFPDDKATSEQFIMVEPEEIAIANGELMEIIQKPNGKKTFHYKMNLPHSVYLISFVVGRYSKVEDKYRNIPLGFYVYPGQESIVPKAFGKTKEMMRIFEELTGVEYPFNKYDQTIVARFRFGGMENITATTLADTEILAVSFFPDSVEDLVSHELAHSWFGNLVTCRNWAELWLNEAFATYMEAAYREKMYGRQEYLKKIEADARGYFAYEAINKQKHGLFNHLARPDDSIFNPIPYQKGSAVLHTLREEIGSEAFWRGVQIYLRRHSFDVVETGDLKNAMEEASGKKLDWFFDQWVYKAGYPRIQIKPVFYSIPKRLVITFRQTHKIEPLIPEAFILPVEIKILLFDGEERIEKVMINKRIQTVSFKLDKPIKEIEFDKNIRLPLVMMRISPLTTIGKASTKSRRK